MSELHSWLSEQTNAHDMRPPRVQFFTSATSVQGHSRRFDYLTATSALPRTTDISDRAGMSEECDFRTISEFPKVNLAHPAGLAYRLPDNQ